MSIFIYSTLAPIAEFLSNKLSKSLMGEIIFCWFTLNKSN